MSGFGLIACFDSEPDGPPDITEATVHHYRIVDIDLPDTLDEIRDFGVDLDDDGLADNNLGAAHRNLRSQYTSFQVEAPARARLASDLIWTLTLYDAGSSGGGAQIAPGVIVDGVVTPLVGETGAAIGAWLDGGTVLRGGSAYIPLGGVTDAVGGSRPGWSPSSVVGIRVEAWDDREASVTLGLGMPLPDVETVLFPNLAAYFTTKLDDPDAGYAQLLDADDDGVITALEIAADELMDWLVASDLGDNQISIGVRLRATAL